MAVVPGNSGSPGSGNSGNQSTMTANQQNNERQGITSRTSHWGRLCHRICAQRKPRKPHKKHCQETRKESLRVTEPEAHANKCVIIGSHNLSSTKQIVHTDPSLALC